jgi:hypothetical protein
VRRALKIVGVLVLAGVATVLVLYAFGARVVLDGGGGVHVAFMPSAAEQAQEIAAHREAQRAAASGTPAEAVPAPPAADPAGGTAGPGTAAAVSDAARGPHALVDDWADFRGPFRDGRYRGHQMPGDWPAGGLAPLWKQPIGGGYASFVVADGRAFTIEQRGTIEVASAYDVQTGRELWTDRWTAAFRELMGGDGPRATPSWTRRSRGSPASRCRRCASATWRRSS